MTEGVRQCVNLHKREPMPEGLWEEFVFWLSQAPTPGCTESTLRVSDSSVLPFAD